MLLCLLTTEFIASGELQQALTAKSDAYELLLAEHKELLVCLGEMERSRLKQHPVVALARAETVGSSDGDVSPAHVDGMLAQVDVDLN